MKTVILKTAREYPTLPYDAIKNDILGSAYTLTLVFVGKTRARELNRVHRKKTYVPNVLSFPLEKNVGEVYIAPSVAKREAKKFGMTPRGYIGFLFIHALFHLKGHHHGDTMEKAEKRFVSKYALK